jgi:phosphoribosylformylglycinamidine synthase subunit PurSL
LFAQDVPGCVDHSKRQRLDSLLNQLLRDCTEEIDAPFVKSAFIGNAGIISFVPGISFALKAETHNHPSAVEAFGGANTGVGGVVRDILG